MYFHKFHHRLAVIATGLAFMAYAGWASADPPSRAARLAYTAGSVSFSPAGENEWFQATRNRPLTNGDRLWADADARMEIEVGGATFRMDGNTSVSVLNLDDNMAQLQLTQGTLNLRVRRLAPNQVFEVDTPNLAFTVREVGDYRITVDPQGDATDVVVRRGRAQVDGEGAAYTVDASQPYRFTGTGLRDYQNLAVPAPDAFDRWAGERERGYASSPSARYVSPDVVGYQELDNNGTWRVDASFGNVWVPNRVAAGWTPYRDGHWAWVDPWGWTWIDDAPWGYAVSHYGRWTNMRGTWGWVPGPVRAQAYYAPALVAFVGGDNFRLTISSGNVGGVAWFPLAPREVYRPSYNASRGYIENVNRSNTVVNNTVINNTVINTTNVTNVVYANRQVPGAVIAVPTAAFVQAQPVSKAAVRVSSEMLTVSTVAAVAPVAPTERSVHGAADSGSKPPARVFERQVVARTAPPVAHAGFAAQQEQLAKHPGKPLDDTARKALPVVVPTVAAAAAGSTAAATGAATAPAAHVPAVKVVAAAPVAVAVPAAVTPKPPAVAATPAPPVVGAAPATAPPAVAQPPQQRGKSGQRDGAEPKAAPAPIAAPPAPVPAAASKAPAAIPTPPAAPVAAPPAAVAQPPQQRGKSGQRDAAEPKAAPQPPPRAAAVPAAPAAPAVAAQRPPPRPVEQLPRADAQAKKPRPGASQPDGGNDDEPQKGEDKKRK